MKVTVIYNEKSFEVQTNVSGSVALLQAQLAERFLIPESEQRLSLISPNSKVLLAAEELLSSYPLLPKSVVYLKSYPRAPPNSKFPSGSSALLEICTHGDPESLYDLLDSLEQQVRRPLQAADLSLLLNSFIDSKWTCIHHAAFNGHSKLLKELIELSADINITSRDNWTPLQISCSRGQIECVKVLLSTEGIEINKFTCERGSGLHLAAKGGYVEIVRTLLKEKVDVAMEDLNGKTAYDLAKDPEVAEEISKHISGLVITEYSETVEKPLGFSGEIWFTSGSAHTEKLVFLSLDPNTGCFIHFHSRSDYINEFPPKHSIPFEYISGVKVSAAVYDDKHFFVITTAQTTLQYYTEFKDMTLEWTQRILGFIKYFRMPGARKISKSQSINFPVNENFKNSVSLREFEIIEEIGVGKNSKVFRVRKKDTNEVFALKVFNKARLRQKKIKKSVDGRSRALRSASGVFVVRLFWVFENTSHVFWVLEYCELGELSGVIQHLGNLTEGQARIYLAEVIVAVEALHQKGVTLSDLNPSSILLDDEGHVSLHKLALPEVHSKSSSFEAIFMIGKLLFTLLTRETNLLSLSDINISEDSKDFIQKTTVPEKLLRPTLKDLKSHKFFSSIHWPDFTSNSAPPSLSSTFLRSLTQRKALTPFGN